MTFFDAAGVAGYGKRGYNDGSCHRRPLVAAVGTTVAKWRDNPAP
jgi:hypothetical protein